MSLSAIACGRIPDSAKSNVVRVKNWSPGNVQVTCPTQDCPQGVGAVIFMQRFSDHLLLARCTATLIANNEILTNAHCDKSFQPDEAFFFVNVAGRTTAYNLTEKVYDQLDVAQAAGQDVGMGTDLEIYALAAPVEGLTPRNVAREIPHNMSRLVAYVVNDTDAVNRFTNLVLQRETCSTIAHEPIHMAGTRDMAIGLALFNCQVIRGNSGSPMFLPTDLSQIQVVVNAGPERPTQRGEFAYGNRVQCMDIPGLDAPQNHCQRAYLLGLNQPPVRMAPSSF